MDECDTTIRALLTNAGFDFSSGKVIVQLVDKYEDDTITALLEDITIKTGLQAMLINYAIGHVFGEEIMDVVFDCFAINFIAYDDFNIYMIDRKEVVYEIVKISKDYAFYMNNDIPHLGEEA